MTKKKPIVNKFHKVFLLIVVCFVILFSLYYWQGTGAAKDGTQEYVLPSGFEGSYSFDGCCWEPYTEDTSLKGLYKDLYLKGHLLQQESGPYLYLYLDHILAEVSLDGEVLLNQIGEEPDNSRNCGRVWEIIKVGEITADQTVEIHLTNLHGSGNPLAYEDFMSNIFVGQSVTIQRMIQHIDRYFVQNIDTFQKSGMNTALLGSGHLWQSVGIFIILISLMLLAIAFAERRHSSNSFFTSEVWLVASFMLCTGAYMYLDTPDISLVFDRGFLAGTLLVVAKIFVVLLLLAISAGYYQGRIRMLMNAVFYLTALTAAGLLLYCICTGIGWCRVETMWTIWSSIALFIMLTAISADFVLTKRNTYNKEIAGMMIYICAFLLENTNLFLGFWGRGTMINIAGTALIIYYLVLQGRKLPEFIASSQRAQMLEQEIYQNKIDVAYQQMQPDFLYNTLSTISILVKKDPALATEATRKFSTYLRVNLESIHTRRMIPFQEELDHLETYIWLEELRYGEDLQVTYLLQEKAFRIPELALLLLTENLISYHMAHFEDMCSIVIGSVRTDTDTLITVSGRRFGTSIETFRNWLMEKAEIRDIRRRLAYLCDGTLSVEDAEERDPASEFRIDYLPQKTESDMLQIVIRIPNG